MATTKTRPWDAAEHLETDEEKTAYLEAVLEEGDTALMSAALEDVVRACADAATRRFTFHPLTEADLPLLHEWLNRPHVSEWWHAEPSVDEVREKYLPRIAGADAARPFLAHLDGQPAAYIQYYLAGAVPDWWPDEPGPGVLGIDQFLADGARLGQGLGTELVSLFTGWLFENHPEVTEIRVDPHPDNMRAIRCYRKAGFQDVGSITTPDGAAWMMVLERKA